MLELGLNFAPAVAAPSKTALKELAKNDEIEILPADKGNATVVMNTADYEEKVNTLVKSNYNYKCLKKDSTQSQKGKSQKS